jgi:hypothetical protein
MNSPKLTLEKINKVITGWETLAPEKTFAGMTLSQYKARIQPSLDSRARIQTLEEQLQAEKDKRDQSDAESLRVTQMVVNGVLADPTEGPDSPLYAGMGYVRDSERKSGLTHKKKGKPDSK